jgi:hypothetical protein
MFTKQLIATIIVSITLLCSNVTVKAQVPQADFKSVVWYDIWSYDQYPPHRMQYNGIKQLVMFGGGTTGITPSTTAPYFPARDYASFAYRSTFHGDGWATMSKYFPGTTKTWMQLIRDSCNAHGIDLYLDLGGEYGAPATAFNNLISDRTKWTAYINAVSEVCQSNPDGVRFDGISFDIEWLGSSAQNRQDFTDFVAAFKAKLNTWPKPGKIGAATAMWFLWSNNPSTPYITPSTVNAYFDWLFIMGYNTFNGSKLGFEAQVYQHPSITGVEVWNDRATTQYTSNGVNPKIVVLGTSGEVLKQTIAGSAVPGGPASGSTTASGSGPVVNQIFSAAVLDPIAKASYAISGSTWYSFETFASTNEKIKITQSYGLGGIGYYSTFASNDGTGATSVNKPLNAYQNAVAAVIGGITPPADLVKPVVSITAPANGAAVTGSVSISATATDNIGVTKVELLVNGIVAATDVAAPYTTVWSTAGLQGAQIVSARAYDAAGNIGTSASVTVIVLAQPQDTTKPSVSLTSPVSGSVVSGTVTVNANASDNVGVARVDLLVNGVAVLSDNAPPYAFSWNTGGLSGSQALSVKAYDAAGNVGVGTTVTVTVQSLPPPSASSSVYSDSLVSPWRDTSWNSTNTYKSVEQTYAGSYAIKAVQTAWGALSLRSGTLGSPVDIDPAKYARIEFAVYNTTPGLILNVFCYNDRGDLFPNNVQGTIPVNQWTIISVPMAQLDPNNFVIHRINIQNYTRLGPVYYVDNVQFVSGSPVVLPPPVPVLLSPPNGAALTAPLAAVSWNASAGAALYEVQVSGSSGFATTILDDSTLTTTSRQVPLLVNGTSYVWRVRAKNGSGWSAYSNGWSFTTVPSSVADQWMYLDGLVSPWKDSSWSATNIFASTEHVFAGSLALKTTQTAWGAVSMRSGSMGGGIGVDPSQYARFEFAVYNTTANLILNVSCYNDRGDVFPAVVQNTVPVNQWTVISVPMSQLDPNGYTINRVNIQNYTRLNPTYYLDNVRFVPPTLAAAAMPGGGATGPVPASLIEAPQAFALMQNFPNPFNPTTQIGYQLTQQAFVTLRVYNVLGSEVSRLVEAEQVAGSHTAMWNAGNQASGIYFARLTVTNADGKRLYQQMMRMLLAK